MNCILILFTVFIVFLLHCEGATISENALDPAVPGECLYKGEHYVPGDHQLPGCIRLVCSPKGWASIHTCFDSSKKGCSAGNQVYINQPFPDCCKKTYYCKNEDGSRYTIKDF